jgi:NAD(P) transhydrogenase subunit alpha
MKIGVVRENAAGERRVALIPQETEALGKAGHELVVETDAGRSAGFDDAAYAERGCVLATRSEVFEADVVVFVNAPGGREAEIGELLERLRPGQATIGLSDPLGSPSAARELARRNVTSFALELLPRITRAQAMDVLSSQAALTGYKASLIAAERLDKIFPMLTTAAGTLPPARALVIGAGVAGLQAIATCRRLGARVSAYDVRAASREQVESVGGTFVELDLDTARAEGTGGYAAKMDEDFYRRQREALGAVIAAHDVVITTAQVPGQRAPVLVTAPMVHGMGPGSVLVDTAAATGGNCELSRPDEIVEVGGVTLIAPTNLPATVPAHASRLYAKNLGNFLRHVLADGKIRVDADDEIIAGTLVTHGGQVVSSRVREALGEPPLTAATATAVPSGAALPSGAADSSGGPDSSGTAASTTAADATTDRVALNTGS